MNKEKIDQMFGQLHKLAELEVSQLEKQCTLDNIEFVKELLKNYWIAREIKKAINPAEFAELIFDLRSEEKEWSNKLASMLIAVEDCSKEGDTEKINEYFNFYLENCPCLSLTDIAKIERSNYFE